MDPRILYNRFVGSEKADPIVEAMNESKAENAKDKKGLEELWSLPTKRALDEVDAKHMKDLTALAKKMRGKADVDGGWVYAEFASKNDALAFERVAEKYFKKSGLTFSSDHSELDDGIIGVGEN